MSTWLPSDVDARHVLPALHRVGVNARAAAVAAPAGLLDTCRDVDARLNSLLSGQLPAAAFADALAAPVPGLRGASDWLDTAYEPAPVVAFLHAVRAFFKAAAWHAESGTAGFVLARWFDALEVLPLELMRLGPEAIPRALASYADHMPPFTNAANVYRAVLRGQQATRVLPAAAWRLDP